MIEYNIRNFGAIGDGITDDSVHIQKAIDSCAAEGGGRVVFPAGYSFMSGPINLRSHIEYNVQKESHLFANPSEEVYTESAFKANKGEGTIWIGGKGLKDITFTGGGIIDGNGCAFMGEELHDSFELKPFDIVDPRPHLLTLIDCHNIKVHDITFKDAAYWGLHFIGCSKILVDNTTIDNNLKIRNGDGIDLNHCKDAVITNCNIASGDDAICFKNRREYSEYGACEDISVSNCVLTSASCAIKFGSENVDSIRNVTISDCIIKDSNRGIGFQNRDEGTISNITISNITIDCHFYSDVWWGKSEPIYITAFPRASTNEKDAGIRFPEGATEGFVGTVSDISLSNIKIDSENGIFIGSNELQKIQDIRMDNIDIHIKNKTDYKGGLYDCRPCEGVPMIHDETFGIYIIKATDVLVSNWSLKCDLSGQENGDKGIKIIDSKDINIEPYKAPAELEATSSLTIE